MTATANDAPAASVVIPHLDTPELLARCLASVSGQTLSQGPFEVIVVDNGSRRSLDAVRAAFPEVRFLAEPRAGPGLARNTGAAAARAPVLVFIDADCRAEAGWLQAAVDAVSVDVTRTVVGGDVRIDFVDPKNLTGIEAYEAVFAYRQKLYIESRRFSGTGNLAMGAPVLAAVGPFAGIETAEDIDWGERATAAGYPARYVADMRIYHPGRTDFTQLQRKWARHIAHFHHAHVAAGKPAVSWYLLAMATLASSLWHVPRILTSDQLSGLGNRWRGIAVLLRIRAWRCAEMLRAAGGRNRGATAWNPAA